MTKKRSSRPIWVVCACGYETTRPVEAWTRKAVAEKRAREMTGNVKPGTSMSNGDTLLGYNIFETNLLEEFHL